MSAHRAVATLAGAAPATDTSAALRSPSLSGGGATGLERRRLYQLISPVCVRFNNICVTQEARWAWTTPRCASASSGGLSLSPGRRAAVGHSTAVPRTTCACWCSPTSWCSARLACVFAAPGLARNGIRLGRPLLQRSSGLVVLELLPTESLGRVLALPAALRQGAIAYV